MNTNNNVKHPCQGCVYYNVCGESTRTMYCAGRRTKRQRQNAVLTNKQPEVKS